MKIDFSVILMGIDENPMKRRLGSDEIATLKDIAFDALLSIMEGDRSSGEEKFRRYELAMKIKNEKDVDLPIEDVALIKKLIGSMYSPLVVGQAWKVLDAGGK